VSAAAAGLAFAFVQPSLARADDAVPVPVPGLPDAFPTVPAAPPTESSATLTSDASAAPDAPDPGSAPAVPADLGEEIVADVQEAAGNVDVTVRVLSPGSDGPVTQNSASPNAIPEAPQSDITASSQTETTPDAAADPSAPESPANSPSSSEGGGNTNVTVRVLSPGDNGPVTQTNDATDDLAAAAPSAAADDTAPAAATPPTEGSTEVVAETSDSTDEPLLSGENATRYQEEDSQYQSDVIAADEPWYWSWELTIDCAGDVTSMSNETGSRSSPEWTWEWMWDWSCDHGHDPAETPGSAGASGGVQTTGSAGATSSDTRATNANVSVRVLSPGDDAAVTQTGGAPTSDRPATSGPTTSPWSWNWTFTFCGQTYALATELAVQGDLSWLWNWDWDWSCDSAAGPPPDLGGAAESSASLPQQGGDTGATTTLPSTAISPAGAPASASGTPDTTTEPTLSFPMFPTAAISIPDADLIVEVAWPTAVTAQTELSPLGLEPGLDVVDITVAIAIDVTASPSPAPAARRVAPQTFAPLPVARNPASAPGRGSPVPALRSTAPEIIVPSRRTPESDPRTPTETPVSVRPAPRRDESAPTPFPFGELQPGQTGVGGAFGGRVPTTQVVGVAASLAFFRVVVPGVGRRIRVTRELSPRSAYRTSIDHPG
jgi:hypothetical protein